MSIPKWPPGLRAATIVTVIYALIWIALEGDLWRAILLAILVTAITFGQLAKRVLGGQRFSTGPWLLLTSLSGLTVGLICALLTLVLMALKTGLHSHGPEFTADEIAWVYDQAPYWGLSGMLAGIGLGMLSMNRDRSGEEQEG